MWRPFWQNQIKHPGLRYISEMSAVCFPPVLWVICPWMEYELFGDLNLRTWDLEMALPLETSQSQDAETLTTIIHQCGGSSEAWSRCLSKLRMQSRYLGEDAWADCILGLFPHLWTMLSLVVKWGPSYLLRRAVLGPPCMKHSWWCCACFPCDGVMACSMQFAKNHPPVLYLWDHYEQNIWWKNEEKLRKKYKICIGKNGVVCVCVLYV